MKGILFGVGFVVLAAAFLCVTAFNAPVQMNLMSGLGIITQAKEKSAAETGAGEQAGKKGQQMDEENKNKGGVTRGGFGAGAVAGLSAADQVAAAVDQLRIAIDAGNKFSIDRQFAVLRNVLEDAPELARDVPKEVFDALDAGQQATLKQLAARGVAGGVDSTQSNSAIQ